MSNVHRLPEPAIANVKPLQMERSENTRADQAKLLALIANIVESKHSTSALDALASVLQQAFDAKTVSIAMVKKGVLTLSTISQQALVNPVSTESKLIVDAMQEACDREAVVRWPTTAMGKRSELGVLHAHRTLAGRRRSISYCSVPLFHEHQLVGAMLLERRDNVVFSEQQVLLLERSALLIAPLLQLRLQVDQTILSLCKERCTKYLSLYLGAHQPGKRLIALSVSAFVLAASLIPMNAHVSAAAQLVPLERRLITAPRSGFVQSVDILAGESVVAGQVLATLDTRDLILEAKRKASEIEIAEVELRSAMASFNRQATAVSRARLAQSRAQQKLVQLQIAQSSLQAPIAGLILSANPNDSLGAPVTRGDTLFEIAPANDYQVHVLVDESDIREIHTGQQGELRLRARSNEALPLTVDSIHPIAETGQGASRFRIRANIDEGAATTQLRPGESGQAQLAVGKKSLMRIIVDPIWRRFTDLKWRLLG